MKNTQIKSCAVAAGLTLALAGCGAADLAQAQAQAQPVQSVQPTSTSAPKVVASNPLTIWCNLKLGQTKTEVQSAMGQPNGHKLDDYKVAGFETLEWNTGIETLEWNSGVTILLASFESGIAASLQAYDHQIGPQGSSRIKCESFRNSN